MRDTQKGSPTGLVTHEYPAGSEWDIGSDMMPESLAGVFLGEGWAEVVTEDPKGAEGDSASPKKPVEKAENKVLAVPANKAKRARGNRSKGSSSK